MSTTAPYVILLCCTESDANSLQIDIDQQCFFQYVPYHLRIYYLYFNRLASLCSDLGSPLDYNTLESALLILDTNANGKISYDEFIGWYKGTSRP